MQGICDDFMIFIDIQHLTHHINWWIIHPAKRDYCISVYLQLTQQSHRWSGCSCEALSQMYSCLLTYSNLACANQYHHQVPVPTSMSANMSVHPPVVIDRCIYSYDCPSIYLSIHLYAYPSIHRSIHPAMSQKYGAFVRAQASHHAQ